MDLATSLLAQASEAIDTASDAGADLCDVMGSAGKCSSVGARLGDECLDSLNHDRRLILLDHMTGAGGVPLLPC
mgnify:CR=1 FL=1